MKEGSQTKIYIISAIRVGVNVYICLQQALMYVWLCNSNVCMYVCMHVYLA